MKKLVRLLLVASVLYGTGAHWAALQSAAWAGMIATRAGESSWSETLKSTFSGERPCPVCKIVDKGASAERYIAIPGSAPSLELAVSVFSPLEAALSASAAFASRSASASSFAFRPAVPPPKTALPA
ncbi:MAG: hypothetical protein Q8T11_05905 [Elusimicrobiota bacterium]|nr:hypothetical protein [Elusimicrobiota bacterium]